MDKFVALLAGLAAILTALGLMLRVLVKISWELGQMVQRYGDHVEQSKLIHADQEARIRRIEQGPSRRLR